MFCSAASVFQMIFQALFCIIRKNLVGYGLTKLNDTCILSRWMHGMAKASDDRPHKTNILMQKQVLLGIY